MKATELMIGDWVSYDGDISIVTDLSNDDNGEFPPIQVYNKEYGVSGTYRVEPIPLTEDILKVNGFIFNEDYNSWGLNGFIIYNFHNQLCADLCDRYVDLKSVHQLQHLLRDCGWSDLADNFKIQ